ncbi:hypothetical protein R5R35_008684 [Gryllus longicercus]|uniref:Uncharacterized protein n=1 Tax=Gryllus longicercus TaxID=2509291 RepID=A0AAN9VAJ7_9ORTH
MSKADCFKRNSKLESHLKRTLPRHVYDDIRYYESCVVKLPKEALAYQYVILTGKAVLLATYPFKDVKEAVRLHDVLSINVELDIPPFLKACDAHNCQHIRLKYKKIISESQSVHLKIVNEEQEELDSGISVISDTSQSSSSMGPEVNYEEITNWSSSNEYSEDALTIASLEPSRETGKRTDLGNFSRTETITKEKNSFPTKEKQIFNNQISYRRGSIFHQDVKLPVDNDLPLVHIKGQKNKTQLSEEKLSINEDSTINRAVSRSLTNTPELQERSISSLLRRVQYNQPKSSRSFSSMAHYAKSASPLPIAPVEKRSQSVLERPRRNPSIKSLESCIDESFRLYDDLHIYVLQAKPILLNYLQTNWCAYLLNKTLEVSEPNLQLNDVIDSFQLENSFNKLRNEIVDPENSIERTYGLLNELRIGFQRRSQLKYIFWKDQMLYYFLMQKLEQYMHNLQYRFTASPLTYGNEMETDVYIQSRLDELEIIIMLLDVLFDVLHDTDKIHEKMKMLHFRNGTLIKQLLSILVTSPCIPSKFYNTCSRMLEDFNEFSTYAWKNLPEGVLIEMLGTIINKIGGIFSELISTIKTLSESNSCISIATIFKDISMANYLKRSITQLLGLLYPVEQRTLKPEDCVLVYHHFFVIKCLMENVPEVQNYVKERYQEEFRYYILWTRINTRIPEKYPVKRVLRPLIEHVHKIGSYEQMDITLHPRIS